jgi:hypothetical protein
MFAAVRSADSTGTAVAAAHIWFDSTVIADAESLDIFRKLDDFAREFMAKNAWVRINGVPSRKSVKIASTNPDTTYSNQGLSTGRHRAGDPEVNKFTRSIQQNPSHV